MSTNESDARTKLPHRGLTVTVSSRRRETPAGSSNDSRGEITERNWTEFASCRGKPTALFFPKRTDPKSMMKEAKAACEGCLVKRRCLMVGLSQSEREDYGVFGGTSSNERSAIRPLIGSDPDYLYSEEATERYGLHGAY